MGVEVTSRDVGRLYRLAASRSRINEAKCAAQATFDYMNRSRHSVQMSRALLDATHHMVKPAAPSAE